ncbi:hypothetical protein INT48_003715 [Thamnidium elegans]|uniref:FYVE-type domain-containing protein n=1 Tax=Thamnidium elegans TaxID=101142 RepID=A0A8H7VVZ3_9FUNG|nr:hypothetical protein INT48_003715 [Thamnidium elegans]
MQKEKSTTTRNFVARQQSITRGTASSRAKAVKPIDTHNNLSQRRLSVRTRNPSLTNMTTHTIHRRSSLSMHDKLVPSSSTLPERKISIDRSLSSNSSSSSVSTRVHSSCSKKETVTTPDFFKYDDDAVHAEKDNQQKQMNPLETPHETSSNEDIMTMVRTRSNSPTSPIPTRNSNNYSIPEEQIDQEQPDNLEQWNKLIQQQQKVLEFINLDQTNMMTLSSTEFNKSDRNDILETQLELLKRFETLLLFSTCHLTPQVNSSTNEIIVEPELPITNWQTKIEYNITRLKWNFSQLFGTVVGTAQLEEQAFDALGYTDHIVVSGVCVTTEPGLLPKKLQKYYPNRGQLIYHKYVIYVSRKQRLDVFTLLHVNQWQKDNLVKQCQFKENIASCKTEFSLIHRRHHCRSCGHLFCQTHCSNLLPLFISSGQERGEWSRVCDTCFYARIDPQFITK